MKIIICFFIFFKICVCVEDSDDPYFWHGRVKDGINQYDDNLDSKDLHDNKDIIRPCSLHNLDCIRRFFARNSQCLPAEGPAPDPMLLPLVPNLDIPHANLTFTLNYAQVKGLNGWKIEEFYINKATDRLVLEVVFDRIEVTCPQANLKYLRKGKEPLETSASTIIEYCNVSFTLTVPNVRDIQLSRGHVYTYITDIDPKYSLGHEIYSSKDLGFISAIREMEHKVGLSLQEVFARQGPVFFSIFFQSSVCDFRNH